MTKVNCCKDFLSLIEEYTLSRPEIQNPPKNFVKSKKKKEIEDKQTKTTEIRSLFLVTSPPFGSRFLKTNLPELTRDRRVFSGYVNNQQQLI